MLIKPGNASSKCLHACRVQPEMEGGRSPSEREFRNRSQGIETWRRLIPNAADGDRSYAIDFKGGQNLGERQHGYSDKYDYIAAARVYRRTTELDPDNGWHQPYVIFATLRNEEAVDTNPISSTRFPEN
jgi:hypothetical protein